MSATLEEWVRAVFDHPTAEPEWYWNAEFDSQWRALGLSDALTVNYLTRLFLSPQPLKQYSLEQVAQGIWFLIGEASPAQPSLILVSSDVGLRERIACVRAMAHFFRNFVAPAAPGPADADRDPFHIACYMWWDIFPSWGSSQAGEPEIHKACLNVMAEVLALPSELCQLSALHGLNHWRLHYAEQVEEIVDAFLANAGDITPRMREYASQARQGGCQ